ncbi:hypothetical protein ACK4RJ_10670 [Proteus mirabilis]|uniref:hypothetical protein n=1 Tax=Proteus mirabilis TaxID=584 RepID=UPI002993E53C|nr:hypothetical protein [Proteus mirabilis]HDA9902314.1 hypothetical protein [Proteus mirabilis]HEH4210309.1 hypothetical protein [Proteus mirabilis]
MPLSDNKYVSFSEDHELNYHLKKWGKKHSKANRDQLVKLGSELKKKLDVKHLQHTEIDAEIEKNLSLFE